MSLFQLLDASPLDAATVRPLGEATSSGIPPGHVFQLVGLVAVLLSALCVVTIALSSRHLYANKFYPKMPLLASVSWLGSCVCIWLAVSVGDTTAIYVWSYLGWMFDVSARSLLLWFTYIRTATLWPGAHVIKYATAFIQLALLASCAYGMSFVNVDKSAETGSDAFTTSVTVYALIDLLPTLLDVALIHRLWALKLQLMSRQTNSPHSRIKIMFFYFAIVCIVLVAAMPVALAAITITGNDAFFAFRGVFFAFRILLTDVFSNLIRDSLIERHSSDLIQTSISLAPPPPPTPNSLNKTSTAGTGSSKPRLPVRSAIMFDEPPPPNSLASSVEILPMQAQ